MAQTYISIMKNILLISVLLAAFSISCERSTTNDQVEPNAKNAQARDATPANRGTVQFQWAGNTASQNWGRDALLTNAERIEILDIAFSKVLRTQDKADLQCVYDRAKADILADKRFPAGNPSYNFVRNCCPSCAQRLGDVNGARCDLQVNKGTF